MGRGLFSGALWGSLVAVMSLWVLSQVSGMVGLLEAPDQVGTTAPVASTGEQSAAEDAAPQEPASLQQSETDNNRQAEPAALEQVEVDPTPTAPVVTSPSPETVTTLDAPASPLSDETDNQAGVSSDNSGQNGLTVANVGQPVSPDVDVLPQTIPENPQINPPVTADIVSQAPSPPVEPAAAAQATLETALVVAPNIPGGPDQPQSPTVESGPGLAPAGDIAKPVIVPTPNSVVPETPTTEPEESAPEPASEEPDPATEAAPSIAPGGNFAEPVVVPTPRPEPSDTPTPAPEEQQAVIASAEPVPNTDVLDGDGQLESQGLLQNQAQNVRTNRLPTIAGSGEELPEEPVPGDGATAPESTTVSPGAAMQRFSQAFENPENRPMMAILLLPDADSGAVPDTPLPFPVSYVVDASRDDAGQEMQRFRDGGFEVAALMPLPTRATPQDVETAFQIYMDRVSEAVAVIDTEQAEFQSGRAVASQVVQVLAATGHGMITYSKGLNSAPQLAEREGVPAALVFRDFDGNGQDINAIKRFLDQAAFRAGQQSGVILVGRNRPDTVKALLEWSLGNRANTVALAPVSAVLGTQ